jgi:hypothetical protein
MVNYESLSIEMAQGSGENLAAFARTLGCGDASVAAFGKMTQQNYSKIMDQGSAGPTEFLDTVKSQLQADPALSVACRA